MSANIEFWLHIANVLMLITAVAFILGLLCGLFFRRRDAAYEDYLKRKRSETPLPKTPTPTPEETEELIRFHERIQRK